MFAGVAAAALARHAEALDAVAGELVSAVELEGSDVVDRTARELVRAYVSDRALVEATRLIDVEGDPTHGIEPFRDSLVFSLALTVVARLLDASGSSMGMPMNPQPDAVLDLLDRAYRLVCGG